MPQNKTPRLSELRVGLLVLLALAILVLLVGAIQLAAGIFRLGFLTRFVSNAVMIGFLNGVAVSPALGNPSPPTSSVNSKVFFESTENSGS